MSSNPVRSLQDVVTKVFNDAGYSQVSIGNMYDEPCGEYSEICINNFHTAKNPYSETRTFASVLFNCIDEPEKVYVAVVGYNLKEYNYIEVDDVLNDKIKQVRELTKKALTIHYNKEV